MDHPLCEHVFLTAQPNPRTRFARAIKQRNVFLAEVAAAEMETVDLHDALQLVYLYSEAGDAKYERAALKWLKRWIEEDAPSLDEVAGTVCSFVERRGFIAGT